MYRASPDEGALRQGEILTGVVEHQVSLETLKAPDKGIRVDKRRHPFAIVLTQDCDLDWDYSARSRIQGEDWPDDKEKAKLEARRIPAILLCEVYAATEIRDREDINSTIWSQIKINKNERYQFFQLIPAEADLLGEGLPELTIDFKRYFTIPTDELYHYIIDGDAQRRTCLDNPYLEHISHRFASFLSRVALPSSLFTPPMPAAARNEASFMAVTVVVRPTIP